ncbi:MAG: succinylglutamate desuccinylase/aspartoacylase family protein [Myxococcales bacterium]|jgi:hypothetical protein
MTADTASTPLRVWEYPRGSDIGHDPGEFLRRMGGPTCFALPGEDSQARPRIVTTLLHGNEPSGTIALYRFLKEGIHPRVPLHVMVLSVQAALTGQVFTHRAVPGRPDLNRCFVQPPDAPEGELARAVIAHVQALRPEAAVDVHNTSGRGPAYAVVTGVDPAREALTSRFAQRMIHTDIRLGTVMEAFDPIAPTVTIECGGAGDPEAHERAFHGLCRMARDADVLTRDAGTDPLSVLRHPLRIELVEGATVAFAHERQADADVTLPPDVDRLNFGVMPRGRAIGWLGPRGLDALRAVGAEIRHPVDDLFEARDGALVPVRDLEPLMVTTNPAIARSDCLFYLVPA